MTDTKTVATAAQIDSMFERLTSTMRSEITRELAALHRAEHHNECLVDLDTAAVSNEPLGAPAVPQKAWFESLPEFADPRNMAGVVLCGAEKGRFWTMIGEADVPYMSGYDGIEAPIADASTSYYMNERLENPLLVQDDDGEVVEIAAGPIGFGHSPDSIMTVDGVYEWHDREWGEAAKERVIARARLFEVDGPEGPVVVAAGALMPDVTWGEALAVLNSEVSPEFMGVFDADSDELVGIEWVTQTLVFQGNTRTSKSTDARVGRSSVRAELRCVRGSAGQVARVRRAAGGRRLAGSIPDSVRENDDMIVKSIEVAGSADMLEKVDAMLGSIAWAGWAGTSTGFSVRIDGDGSERLYVDHLTPADFESTVGVVRDEEDPDYIDVGVHLSALSLPERGNEMKATLDVEVVVAAVKAGDIDLVAVQKACGATPCGPCSAKAEEDGGDDVEVDEALAEAVAAATAELRAERDALLNEQYDAMQIDTTPVKATINTHSELRDAVSSAVYARYDTDTTYAYVIDYMLDNTEVIFEVSSADGYATWRQAFTLDAEAHTAELSGEPVQIVRETQYIDL